MTDERTAHEIEAALFAFFDPNEIKFKPGAVSGNRALALAYVDARVIQDRLDEVLGVAGWQDDYTVVQDGSVVCKLSCLIAGEWVQKMDVGSPSEQPDSGDRIKAAFSDALKRAAVKFGIGRYLYRLPMQWRDYDPQKRQFVKKPELPATFQPKAEPAPAIRDAGLKILGPAADKGWSELQLAWKAISAEMKQACKADLDNDLKPRARAADDKAGRETANSHA